jgi:predicted dehydrogenase
MNTKYSAGAIARTGSGDFGHDLDVAFNGIPNVQFVAVADPDAKGFQLACKRTGANRFYLDYHEMLEKENLDLVSVGTRWIECHADMVIACAETCAKTILLTIFYFLSLVLE